MRVLLVSTYELGHQPLHLAAPAAALLAAGHQVDCWDSSVEPWDAGIEARIGAAQAVAVSVPMHTAMRLAVPLLRQLRARRPDLPLACFGLYAGLAGEPGLGSLVDAAFAGEYEAPLLHWVLAGAPTAGDTPQRHGPDVRIELGRARPAPDGGRAAARQRVDIGARAGAGTNPAAPARHLLPPLDRYAQLMIGDERRNVGYVEATRGCAHRCLHCPVPAVYGGRTRVSDEDALLADIEQLVRLGARHITFGDPDFLNRPGQADWVTSALHNAFPDLSYDCTVKIEHVLRHEELWPDLAARGCLFVVSAVESTDDAVLARLDKGHTTADTVQALGILRSAGIEPRPSWLPFTPWTTLDSVADLVDFVAGEDLVTNTDTVQYGIRLLVPPGSLLLARAGFVELMDGFDAEALSWTWHAAVPEVDALQRDLAAWAEQAAARQLGPDEAWDGVCELVAAATGRHDVGRHISERGSQRSSRPRLSEAWFCCAEPTDLQLGWITTFPGMTDGALASLGTTTLVELRGPRRRSPVAGDDAPTPAASSDACCSVEASPGSDHG